jgi:hypothetical protein
LCSLHTCNTTCPLVSKEPAGYQVNRWVSFCRVWGYRTLIYLTTAPKCKSSEDDDLNLLPFCEKVNVLDLRREKHGMPRPTKNEFSVREVVRKEEDSCASFGGTLQTAKGTATTRDWCLVMKKALGCRV